MKDHLFTLPETKAFDFLHEFSMAESRMAVDRRTDHYLLDPEHDVAR